MSLLFILLLLLILVVPQYMLQRKQRAHLQRLQALRDSLNIGDVVVTGAGMHGTVRAIAETSVDLEIGDGVISTWEKEAIIRNLSAEQTQAESLAAGEELAAAEDSVVDNEVVEHPENHVEGPVAESPEHPEEDRK